MMMMTRVICLQILTVFSISGRFISVLSSNVLVFKDVTQTKIHIAEPVVIKYSAFDLQMANEKLKRHKSPSIDYNPTKLIPAAVHKVSCVVYELFK
jgi:hypothetical protein